MIFGPELQLRDMLGSAALPQLGSVLMSCVDVVPDTIASQADARRLGHHLGPCCLVSEGHTAVGTMLIWVAHATTWERRLKLRFIKNYVFFLPEIE